MTASLIDVANVCVLSFCWLVVVWLPMWKVTKENFVDHTRCAKRESCNRNHLDAETLCHKKNSHLNMTCREGHSKDCFRSSFFMLMMVVILPPTQYVVEEKLRMQMFLIWRQMPNPATAYLRTMGNACKINTFNFAKRWSELSIFNLSAPFFHVIAVFSLIQEK